MSQTWSILIPTLKSRATMLSILMDELKSQIAAAKAEQDIEIITMSDNKEKSVGYKRNQLKDYVRTRFLSYIDDDDWVSPDYISSIYDAINMNPDIDVIVFDVHARIVTPYHPNGRLCKYGIEYKRDHEDRDFYYRLPNHLMVWQKNVANMARFPEVNFGEDAHWAKALSHHIKTQHRIEKTLYTYRFDPLKTETQRR